MTKTIPRGGFLPPLYTSSGRISAAKVSGAKGINDVCNDVKKNKNPHPSGYNFAIN